MNNLDSRGKMDPIAVINSRFFNDSLRDLGGDNYLGLKRKFKLLDKGALSRESKEYLTTFIERYYEQLLVALNLHFPSIEDGNDTLNDLFPKVNPPEYKIVKIDGGDAYIRDFKPFIKELYERINNAFLFERDIKLIGTFDEKGLSRFYYDQSDSDLKYLKGVGIIRKNSEGDNEVLLEPIYQSIFNFDENGIAQVGLDAKVGLIKIEEDRVIELLATEYDEIGKFDENGIAYVRIGSKYGLVQLTENGLEKILDVDNELKDLDSEYIKLNNGKTVLTRIGKKGEMVFFIGDDLREVDSNLHGFPT